MKPLSAIGDSFRENPGTWIAFGVCAVLAYWAYSTRRDMDEICDLAQPATEIIAAAPLDEDGHPISATDLKAMVADLKRMRTEHTVDGELWRWQQYEGAELQRVCSYKTADTTQ